MGATETEVKRASRRVVLDTNVVASALLFPGPTTSVLRRAWKSGQVVPLVCRETTLELLRVLAYPRFALTDEDVKQFVADYLPFTEVVAVADGSMLGPKCRDANDQIFVELAIAGRAECIVTGDKALLELDGVQGLRVIGPARLFTI